MATDNYGRTVRRHSGDGQFVSSLALCLVPIVAILASFWLFTMPENWGFVLGILVYSAALLIPTWIISSKTAARSTWGRELTIDVPHSSEGSPQQIR
ncbi:MAG: hypothetical protein Q4C81_07885 [Kocuria sp.]|nr:hypothetical protein [Kocuria sp.]